MSLPDKPLAAVGQLMKPYAEYRRRYSKDSDSDFMKGELAQAAACHAMAAVHRLRNVPIISSSLPEPFALKYGETYLDNLLAAGVFILVELERRANGSSTTQVPGASACISRDIPSLTPKPTNEQLSAQAVNFLTALRQMLEESKSAASGA